MHATADKAVYVYEVANGITNETVTLTGNAKVENANGWLTGEPIVWSRNGTVTATNEHMVYWANLNGTTAGTNAPAETNAPVAGTNSPVAAADLPPVATNRPVVDTNFPPGKLDLIPPKISKPESK